MPLPLAFANPRGGRGIGEKGLYSISEADDEGSDGGREESNVLELLRNKATSASSKNNAISSRSSSNTVRSSKSDRSSNRSTTKSSNPTRRKSDDINQSSEQQRLSIPSSTHSTKQSITTTVGDSDNTIANELSRLLLEVQQKHQDDAKGTHELSKSILDQVATNQENISIILQGMKQLQESIIDTSKSLDMLSNSVKNGLGVLTNELKTSNAEHNEALSSLKVCCLKLIYMSNDMHSILLSHHDFCHSYQQRTKENLCRLRSIMKELCQLIKNVHSRRRLKCYVMKLTLLRWRRENYSLRRQVLGQ